MPPSLNANKLLFGAPEAPDFYTETKVPDSRIQTLRGARDAARGAIAASFGNWQTIIERAELLEAVVQKRVEVPAFRPKFRRQGSYAYATLNDPAHQPPQQVDFDDGVFLPTTFLQPENALQARRPIVTSRGYFRLIETALAPLCRLRGWQLDVSKPSCVRIVIDSKCHLDIALYAIPDAEFGRLVETARVSHPDEPDRFENLAMDEAVYRDLSRDEIMLARRDVGWQPSDPRAMENWFLGTVRVHGEQLRRVCRYLKAWRDFRWPAGCRVSSIAIMKCVADTYDGLNGQIADNRDDVALLTVAEKLPAFFADLNGIGNPIHANQRLNDGWTEAQRSEYVAAARELATGLRLSSQSTTAQQLIVHFRTALGPRIPSDATLIATTTAEASIKQFARTKVQEPQVYRSTSG